MLAAVSGHFRMFWRKNGIPRTKTGSISALTETAAMMTVSALGSVTAGAFEQKSYAEDVSVYVNGQKIDNGQYKPIIANDRTLLRLVPIFCLLYTSPSPRD